MRKKKYSPKNPRKRNPVGRPAELTEEIATKIREEVIAGKLYKNIQKDLSIPSGTWDHWHRTNYHGFKDNLITYDHEYKLKLAQENITKVLKMDTIEPVIGMFGPILDKKTKKAIVKENDKLIKIKSDMTMFVAETLGRKNYTKKIEVDDVTDKKIILLG